MGAITQFRAIVGSIKLGICTNVLTNKVSHALLTVNSSLSKVDLAAILSSSVNVATLSPGVQTKVREIFADGLRSQLYILMAFEVGGIISTLVLLFGTEVRYEGPSKVTDEADRAIKTET